MKNIDFFELLSIILWLLLFVFWVVKSKKKGFLNEIAGLSKLLLSGLLLHVLIFLNFNYFSYKKFLTIKIIGLGIIALGFFICILARQYLSKNWSGKVAIQKEHSLIINGPYKIIRHPIYSGVLIMMIGSSIIIGNLFCFIWVIFCFMGLYRKSKQEEHLLEKEFGEEYDKYKKGTKMMIPYLL